MICAGDSVTGINITEPHLSGDTINAVRTRLADQRCGLAQAAWSSVESAPAGRTTALPEVGPAKCYDTQLATDGNICLQEP